MNAIIWFVIFFVPAYVANMAPVFFKRLDFLDIPLDCGFKWNSKPLFGRNKTWRGLVVGTVFGGTAGIIMQLSGLGFTWWWGFVLGFAALLGDAVKSLIKRQRGIRSGGSWMPWDQLDFIIAAYIASLWMTNFSISTVLIGFVVVFVGNVIVQLIGGATRLKADSL